MTSMMQQENSSQLSLRSQSTSIDSLLCISNILEEIIMETDQLESTRTIFHASKKPAISLYNYLQRIQKYSQCSEQCYILALIYLDRIQEHNPNIVLNSLCIHRFLIVCILIAIKYQDDEYYKNEYYAKVGGITLKEINELESQFLELIRYDLFVEEQLYSIYLEKIQQYAEI